MISLFDKELIAMEREVRDLKTIHQRGLGTTRFYVYDREITIPGDYYEWYFIGTVEDSSTIPMVAIPLVGGASINPAIGYQDNKVLVSSLAGTGTVYIRFISSSALTNIETRIEPWS